MRDVQWYWWVILIAAIAIIVIAIIALSNDAGGRLGLGPAASLATPGFLNENGCPFAAASIKSMLD
jgi:hypothetical protein